MNTSTITGRPARTFWSYYGLEFYELGGGKIMIDYIKEGEKQQLKVA